MAIQLNSNGLYLNYPTSTSRPSGTYPVGCIAIFTDGGSKITLGGTWIRVSTGSSYVTTTPGNGSEFTYIRVA